MSWKKKYLEEYFMSQEKVMNRWFVVVGAVLIQLCLGAIYAWSVFTKRITAKAGNYEFAASEAAWIFSAGLFFFALVMVWAGRQLTTIGPRKLTIAGGLVLGVGYVLAGLFGNSFLTQLLFIGVIGGSGIGLAYVVPIAVGVKWFPDKKGMLTGLAVAGFGFGATIWIKWADSWGGGLLNTLSIGGLDGVRSVFLLYGIIFAVLVSIASFVMVNPPEGWLPKGYTPPKATATSTTGAVEFETMEMLRTPQFYMIFITFLFSAIAGLMVIYCIRLFGVDTLTFAELKTLTVTDLVTAETLKIAKGKAAVIAGTAAAWLAILNGLGRIAWGTVSDKIGRKTAMLLMCLFQGIAMLSFYSLGSTAIGLIIIACISGFNFGGNFALFPAATADFFGNKNVGKNYGFVFFAYGIAGLTGPSIAGFFKDSAKGAADPSVWVTPFIIVGIGCFLSAVIMLLAKAPKKTEQKVPGSLRAEAASDA